MDILMIKKSEAILILQNRFIHVCMKSFITDWRMIMIIVHVLVVHCTMYFLPYWLLKDHNTEWIYDVYPLIVAVHWDIGGGVGDQVRPHGERGGEDHPVLQPPDQLHRRHPDLRRADPGRVGARGQGPRPSVPVRLPGALHPQAGIQVMGKQDYTGGQQTWWHLIKFGNVYWQLAGNNGRQLLLQDPAGEFQVYLL